MLVRILTSLGLGITGLSAQWTPVPAWDFSASSASDFADHELEVPYFLRHFAQVANAVIETGDNRGFLDIKVNREPVDNQPYNARIMEMQMALAYFYTADRPWNPYRGNGAVRARLEAMLDRWTRIQAPDGHAYAGLFAEYSSTNWSLAPTSFGSRAAAEALDLIIDSGQPFDAAILENARVSLRRALMAVFTRGDMRNAAKQYSNQFGGCYHAALIYLENWPDAELDAAFVAAVNAAAAQDQSPAGFWYEQGGPDFGYSGVHETSLRMALPRFRSRAGLMPVLVDDDEDWNAWLAANYVPQPGLATRTFLTNAGINTRTSHALQTARSRPWSELVEASRIFAFSDAEFAAAVAARRAQVAAQFGNWGALSVPSAYSYIPGFVHDARASLDTWHPTAAQRDAAHATLPCLSMAPLNLQFHDPRPTTYTMAKRPGYYAAVTTGSIRLSRQAYGLGLLWNPAFGIGLQSVAGTLSGNPWVYGTKRSGMTATYETANIPATVMAGGTAVTPSNGGRTLPAGDLEFTYALAGYGSKTITLGSDGVDVAITHSGDFSELLPLAHADDAVSSSSTTRLMLQRPNGSWLLVETTTPGASISVASVSAFATGIVRRPVTITANGSLAYRITLGETQPPLPPPPPPPPPPGSVIVEYVPGNGWDGAYQGNFRITNFSSATITGWELDFDFTGTNISFFNGILSKNGIRHTLKPVSWQATIGPGQAFDNLGFQASPNLPAAIPTNFFLRVTSATGVAPLQIVTSALPETKPAEAFAHTLTAGGGIGPYRWSFAPSTSPPPGVSVSESGMLAGAVDNPGTFPLPLRVTDARGIFAEITLSLTVSAPDAYSAWNAVIGWLERDSAPGADPDADGLANLMEYALGGDPLVAEPSIRPESGMENGLLKLRFQRVADPALLYEVLAATDPASWDVIWSSTGAGNASGLVTVSDLPPEPAPARRFLRLRVSRVGGN